LLFILDIRIQTKYFYDFIGPIPKAMETIKKTGIDKLLITVKEVFEESKDIWVELNIFDLCYLN